MSKTVLEVSDVRKKLGKRQIIKGISFSIKEGEIYGFVGQNGAGKTTTIRMMVGLIKPNSGKISIMGKDVQSQTVEALKKVGVIVENPELYNYLSGRQNLKQIARMYGNIPKERIDKVIELVGLKDRIDDKVKRYSLGMKQRLGLAQALLCEPKLLVLDEPTNGLDPVGIMEFRNIIKSLAKENNTAVFISSHILSEIEQVCDTVAFIDGGEIKSIENMHMKAEDSEIEQVTLVVSEPERCAGVLSGLSFVQSYEEQKGKFHLVVVKGSTPKVVAALVAQEVSVEEIFKVRHNLEKRFIEIVEGGKEACGA